MGTLGDFKLNSVSTTTASETVTHDNLKELEQSPPLSVKCVVGIKLSPMRSVRWRFKLSQGKRRPYDICVNSGPEMIARPSPLSLSLHMTGGPNGFHDQYPDHGDKVEEILFSSLQASKLSTLVNDPVKGLHHQTHRPSDSGGRISDLSMCQR